MHGARYGRVGCADGHDIKECVHHFIAIDAENGGAQYLPAFRVNHHFHEPLGFAPFAGTAHGCHHALGNKRLHAPGFHFFFGHSDAAQRWISK